MQLVTGNWELEKLLKLETGIQNSKLRTGAEYRKLGTTCRNSELKNRIWKMKIENLELGVNNQRNEFKQLFMFFYYLEDSAAWEIASLDTCFPLVAKVIMSEI